MYDIKTCLGLADEPGLDVDHANINFFTEPQHLKTAVFDMSRICIHILDLKIVSLYSDFHVKHG